MATAAIPKLLDKQIDKMVKKHFKKGGIGYIENSSIYNLMKIDL